MPVAIRSFRITKSGVGSEIYVLDFRGPSLTKGKSVFRVANGKVLVVDQTMGEIAEFIANDIMQPREKP